MTYVTGPIAVPSLLATVGLTLYRLIFVERAGLITDPDLRWEAPQALGNPFGFYLVCCLWGVIAGDVVCPLTFLVRRARGRRTATRADI